MESFCLAAQADEKLLSAQLAAVEREASAAARQLEQSTAELAALEGLAGGVGRKRAGLEEQVRAVAHTQASLEAWVALTGVIAHAHYGYLSDRAHSPQPTAAPVQPRGS